MARCAIYRYKYLLCAPQSITGWTQMGQRSRHNNYTDSKYLGTSLTKKSTEPIGRKHLLNVRLCRRCEFLKGRLNATKTPVTPKLMPDRVRPGRFQLKHQQCFLLSFSGFGPDSDSSCSITVGDELTHVPQGKCPHP